jgi:Protein of unknown function (DUF1501)
VSKVQGPVNKAVPPHLTLMYNCGERRWGYPGTGGFLGMAHAPFRLVAEKGAETKNDNMVLKNLTLDRLNDRMALLKSFDSLNRGLDTRGVMEGMDSYGEQAMGILTSSKLVDAIDLSKEPAAVVERYGVNDPAFERDGAPRMVRNFCIARRLVEAGARVVTLNFTRWDWHGGDGKNYVQARKDFPLLDKAICALVEDLHERGLDKDVSVVVWGEFGRTPKINKDAGRDHWPKVFSVVLAGGGIKRGTIYGSSNATASEPERDPIGPEDLATTVYHLLGIVADKELMAPGNRPIEIVDGGKVVKDLLA